MSTLVGSRLILTVFIIMPISEVRKPRTGRQGSPGSPASRCEAVHRGRPSLRRKAGAGAARVGGGAGRRAEGRPRERWVEGSPEAPSSAQLLCAPRERDHLGQRLLCRENLDIRAEGSNLTSKPRDQRQEPVAKRRTAWPSIHRAVLPAPLSEPAQGWVPCTGTNLGSETGPGPEEPSWGPGRLGLGTSMRECVR